MRRHRLKDRPVHDLDSCLDPINYDDLILPDEHRELSCILRNKTRDTPVEHIVLKNVKANQTGRQGRQNIIRTPGWVSPMAVNANTPLECFKLFFTDGILNLIIEQTSQNIAVFLDSLSNEQLSFIIQKKPYVRDENREEPIAYF